MKLDRTLWLTSDRDRVVEDGDPEAAFLLGTAGKEIPDAEAERLGIEPASKKAQAEEKKADEPADKAAAAPANKARKAAKKTAKKG